MNTVIQYIGFFAGFVAITAVLVGVSYFLDTALREGERDGIILRDR